LRNSINAYHTKLIRNIHEEDFQFDKEVVNLIFVRFLDENVEANKLKQGIGGLIRCNSLNGVGWALLKLIFVDTGYARL
jgi:hypothetical protein